MQPPAPHAQLTVCPAQPIYPPTQPIQSAPNATIKLVTTPEKETALLAIHEMCANMIITLYHSSLFTGHQDVIKTYLTIGDKYFIPG